MGALRVPGQILIVLRLKDKLLVWMAQFDQEGEPEPTSGRLAWTIADIEIFTTNSTVKVLRPIFV